VVQLSDTCPLSFSASFHADCKILILLKDPDYRPGTTCHAEPSVNSEPIENISHPTFDPDSDGTINSPVWNNGPVAQWRPPEAASGGVMVATGNAVSVSATSAFAKIKFSANSNVIDTSEQTYVEFTVRALDDASAGQNLSIYLVGADTGDTFRSRCVFSIARQWTSLRLSLAGIGATTGAKFEQLRFRNESGMPVQFQLNTVGLGTAGTDPGDPGDPGNPGDDDLTPSPGEPVSRCTASSEGATTSTAWADGDGSADGWNPPTPLGGGVTVSTGTSIDINSTSSYGKVRIQNRAPVNGFDWIQFDVRSDRIAGRAAILEAYLFSPSLGDTFQSRCRVSASEQWRRYRLPMSAFGANKNTAITQLRLRNGSGAAMRFEVNNIVLGSIDATDPGDPEQPQSSLPAGERLFDWATAVGADPVNENNLRVEQITPPPAGVDASAVINEKLGSSDNVIVNLAAGRYELSRALRLNGNNKILRGDPNGRTTLVFTDIRGPAIQIGSGYLAEDDIAIVRAARGSRSITLNTSPDVARGLLNSVVEIDRLRSTLADDEPPRIYTREGYDRWPGQLNRVTEVSGRVLTMADPLALDYQAGALAPALRKLTIGAGNIGIENLVLRGNRLQNLSSAIYAKNVTNIWVRNVISRGMAGKSHIDLIAVYRCSVQHSVFDDAIGHGDGGAGYGVNLNRHTSGCLIEDNIFHRLRHSMIINLGAAANAFLYNYSTEPVHPNFERGGPADISFHGNYTSANLIEGNVVQRVSITDDCCKSERNNTLLRNCLLSSPLTLNLGSDGQNLVANAIYGNDARLRSTLIDGGPSGQPGGRPALDSGPLFATEEGRDGIYNYADQSRTRYNERSFDTVEFANFHNGSYWYEGRRGVSPARVPGSYFYRNDVARARSIFTTPPAPILNAPTGNEALDCSIPARIRAPSVLQ